MKKLLLTTVMMGITLAANAKDIVFATEPSYPPFELTNEKNELVGFEIDLANAICQKIQETCHFKSQNFDTLIPGLKLKHFDAAMSAIDITEARAKHVLFSDPYYDSSASYIALKGKHDLATAKVVGVQTGTTFQQYTANETKQYESKSYINLNDALLDLKNGRVDIIFGDTAVLAYLIKDEPNIHFVGDKVTNKEYFGTGLGIAFNKSSGELRDKINKGLAEVKASGEYQKIYDKWMTTN